MSHVPWSVCECLCICLQLGTRVSLAKIGKTDRDAARGQTPVSGSNQPLFDEVDIGAI